MNITGQKNYSQELTALRNPDGNTESLKRLLFLYPFGIDQSIAMQVVAVGFIIGVLQDSAETALNSSSDVLFTAAACLRAERLEMERVRKEELINKHLNQGD